MIQSLLRGCLGWMPSGSSVAARRGLPIDLNHAVFALLFIALVFLAACEDVDPAEGLIEDIPPAGSDVSPSRASPAGSPSAASQLSADPFKEGCGDGVCQPSETKCTCVQDCGSCAGSAGNMTEFRCVDGKCRIVTMALICGNSICEEGEQRSCPGDCPVCEPDNNPCTRDSFDYASKSCLHDPVVPCCGNGVCELDEAGSCLIDCKASNFSLKDYPKPFVMGNKVNGFIVVGSNGSGYTVAAGIDLIRGWQYNGSNEGYDTKARLDTELESLEGKNVILLGSACENRFVASLMRPLRDCRDGLEPGVGLIRLYQTGVGKAGAPTYALVIAGYGGEEVRHAAKVVEKYQQYPLTGYQVEVR